MCGLSPVIMVSAMVGITVASLSGSVAAGWLAAAAVAAALYVFARRRSLTGCGIASPRNRHRANAQNGAGADHATDWGLIGRADGAVRLRPDKRSAHGAGVTEPAAH